MEGGGKVLLKLVVIRCKAEREQWKAANFGSKGNEGYKVYKWLYGIAVWQCWSAYTYPAMSRDYLLGL